MELTIIFPVLNEKKRLESGVTRTVEYLRKIDFSDYEIIIVDNGSTDETPQIAKRLCQKYRTVKFERINVRGGRCLQKRRGSKPWRDRGLYGY